MKLSLLERLYVNSPVRNRLQRPLEFHLFQRLASLPPQADVLEIGCGNGGGLAWLARHAQPASLTGLDLDPRQIAAAEHTLAHLTPPARLLVGSAESIPLPANSFHLALSAGCLHHVPKWRTAVTEIHRLLRPGGLFYALEFYAPLLNLPGIRQWLPHPPGRFTESELLAELTRQGFHIVGTWPGHATRLGRFVSRYASLMVAIRKA